MAKTKIVHLAKTSMSTYCGRLRGPVLDTYEPKVVTCGSCKAAHGAQS